MAIGHKDAGDDYFAENRDFLTWKVEAQGDTVYIQAPTLPDAELRFTEAFGNVPAYLVKWTLIDTIPDGEEPI